MRHLLVAAATAVVVLPASTAHAAATADDMIESLALEASELLVEEQRLVRLADPGNPDVAEADRTAAQDRLSAIDAQGNEILGQLRQLDVDVSNAMRATLGVLPPAGGDAFEYALAIPADDVYAAAITDLSRTAATPGAATVTRDVPDESSTAGLLAVAGLAMLALGAAAAVNQLGRRPEHELAAMAWSDSLTGLANRRRLDHDLAGTEDRSTSVIMVDVDHFKSVNDSFGHQHGDGVLRQVGLMLWTNVRQGDVVYRYGGEEFCVLLPDTTVDEAETVATRIVEAAHSIELPDGAHLTVSVGVAGPSEGDVVETVASADRALYDAKDQGRDRAVTMGPERSLEPA